VRGEQQALTGQGLSSAQAGQYRRARPAAARAWSGSSRPTSAVSYTGQVTARGYDNMTGVGTPNGLRFITALRRLER
jgi:hypothetical protein